MSTFRPTLLFLTLLAGTTVCGCAERRILVRTDPPGASVLVNGEEAGTTPLDHPFSFYGTVSLVVRHEGFYSQRIVYDLAPPWYEFFPLDFVSDLLVPWAWEDYHLVETRLTPLPDEIAEPEWIDLETRADAARAEATAGSGE